MSGDLSLFYVELNFAEMFMIFKLFLPFALLAMLYGSLSPIISPAKKGSIKRVKTHLQTVENLSR
jgi:hypothetical protein